MAIVRTDIAIVHHLDDGGMATRIWHADESRADQVAGLLGEPDAQQLMTPELADVVDLVGEKIPTMYR